MAGHGVGAAQGAVQRGASELGMAARLLALADEYCPAFTDDDGRLAASERQYGWWPAHPIVGVARHDGAAIETRWYMSDYEKVFL